MTNQNITSVLSPVQVNEAFEELVEVTKQTKRLQEERKVKLQELANEKASYMESQRKDDPKWTFGKNDTERDANTRAIFPNLTMQVDNVDIKLMQNSEDIALARIEIDRIKTLIRFFQAAGVEDV